MSTNVHAAGQGVDAGKQIVGRQRSIVIDTVVALLGVLITAASVQDSAGQALMEKVAAEHSTVRKTWVAGGRWARLPVATPRISPSETGSPSVL